MLKIKLFRFRINNSTCSDIDDDKNSGWFQKELRELTSIEEIENIVNDFLSTHNVTDISIVPITCRKNENKLRDNDVDLIYSITYEDYHMEDGGFPSPMEDVFVEKASPSYEKTQNTTKPSIRARNSSHYYE